MPHPEENWQVNLYIMHPALVLCLLWARSDWSVPLTGVTKTCLAVVVRASLVVHALLRFDVGNSADGVVVLRLGVRAGHVCGALHQLLEGHPLL